MRKIEVYSDVPPADVTIFIGEDNQILLERAEALELLNQLSKLLTEEVRRTS